MSTSAKRPLDEEISDGDNAPKTSRLDDEDNDGNSDTASTVDFVATVVEDVFYANKIPSPHGAMEALEDNEESVVIILTKSARDTFLTQFQKFQEIEKKLTERTVHTVDRSVPVVQTIPETSKEITRNTDLAEYLKNEFYKICEILNKVQKKFPENILQKNLESTEEFAEFKDTRKTLTDFFVGGAKVVNMISRFASGENDHLLKVKSNIVPNKLDNEYVTAIEDELQKTVTNLNAKLYNETLIKYKECIDRAKFIGQTQSKILAKAWRTVRLSHGDVRNIQFHTKRKRLDTETLHEARHQEQEYDEREMEHENKDRESHQPQQRTYQYHRQEDRESDYHNRPRRKNITRRYVEHTRTEDDNHRRDDQYHRNYNRNAKRRKDWNKHETRYPRVFDTEDEYYEPNRNYNQQNVWNKRNTRYSHDFDTEDEHYEYQQRRRYSKEFPSLRHNRKSSWKQNRHLNE